MAAFRSAPDTEATNPPAAAELEHSRFSARVGAYGTVEGLETVTSTSAEPTRRDFLFIATGAMAAIGGAAVLVPLIFANEPRRRHDCRWRADRGRSGPDFGRPDHPRVLAWAADLRAPSVQEEIKAARDVDWRRLPDPQSDEDRVKEGHAEWLVVYGSCTHLGCIPIGHREPTTAGFALATARCSIPPAASGRDPRRPTFRCPTYEFIADNRIRIG